MNTVIIPGKKKNPWVEARHGAAAVGILLAFGLTIWSWFHIFTADMEPLNVVNFVAGISATISGLAATGLLIWGGAFLISYISEWWKEKESSWQISD